MKEEILKNLENHSCDGNRQMRSCLHQFHCHIVALILSLETRKRERENLES